MIDINYTLNTLDCDILYEEKKRSEHVPRLGELISFDLHRSYQVVDVLWRLGNGGRSVGITACEVNWHQHIKDVTADWEQRRQQG
ncbi:MAG: hypothetical protein ACRDSR_07950 [Pseudonocardiaceae bacterium]